MFVRLKRGGNKKYPHDYLQLVESYRERGKPKQRVMANLGRLDQLVQTGSLDSMIQSLTRFSDDLRIISKSKLPDITSCTTKVWGPVLVFERLWQEQGIDTVIERLSRGRKFQFDIKRLVFAMALQRLCSPGSDLQGFHWVQTVEAEGFDCFELQYFYRTCGFLNDVRHDLERELFFRDRDLFSQELDLVFLDTTSTYIYRETETAVRRRGYSRDRHPELPQMVLCVAVDRHGWPIAWEIFPGNTADQVAFVKVIGILRQRFRIRRVLVVADRGMIAKDTIALLSNHAQAPFEYILGCRMRKQKEITEEVLSRGGKFHKVKDNLEVKEVMVQDRRYIVCRNPERARRDAIEREALIAKIEGALSRGPKSIIGNKGYKRFVKIDKGSVRIDQQAVERDARLDGKFVLRTNTELPAVEVAETYKSLWRVERTFREEKSTLEVRPIFHHRDDTSIGHIVASFLALRLEVDLQRRLDELEVDIPWPNLMRDLCEVRAVHLKMDGESYRVRTDLLGSSYSAFKAARVKPPDRVQRLSTGKNVVPYGIGMPVT